MRVKLVSRQLALFLNAQTVGIVVGGQHDDGVFQHACLLQPLQQKLHCPVQLDLAGKVSAHRLAVRQLLDQGAVFCGDGVVAFVKGIGQMSRNRHVIHMERLLRDKIRRGNVDHLYIGFRPLLRDLQTVSDRLEDIAEIRVGLVAVIICIGMIVEGISAVALPLELLHHRQRHGVFRSVVEAPCTRLWDRACQIDIFAVRGRNAPVGSIKFRKLHSLRLHSVQGRCQLRVDRQIRKALCGNKDQVAAREHARFFIFLCWGLHGKVFVQAPHRLVFLALCQRGKVQLENIILGSVVLRQHRRRRHRLRFTRHRLVGRKLRRLRGERRRLLRGDQLAAVKAEDQPMHIQPERGQQSELQGTLGQIVRFMVEVIRRHRRVSKGRQQQNDRHMQRQRPCRKIRSAQTAADPGSRKDTPVHAEQHCGQQHQQQRHRLDPKRVQDHAPEFQHLSAVSHGKSGIEKVKFIIINELRRVEDQQTVAHDQF